MPPEPTATPAAVPPPPKPGLKPTGPVIRAADLRTWSEAADALAAADRYSNRTREWARAAYHRAKARGFAEGRAEGAAEAAKLTAAATAEAERYLRGLEQALPRLVLDIVEGILGAFEPADLIPLAVRHAVAKLGNGAEVRLRVAPALAEDLRRAVENLGDVSGAGLIRVEADPGLAPGACVMWSEFGNVDLGIEAQVRALRAAMEADPGAEATR